LPRALIALVLQLAGLDAAFRAFVSSEEVPRGKPAPDVYLEAARRIAVAPARAAAVEDSHNGLLAARAAGLRVIAVPNPAFPPAPDALAVADVTLATIRELTPERVDALAVG
jgi:beta-phosphoglucomutase-like phosphatase (HAD superfamily)